MALKGQLTSATAQFRNGAVTLECAIEIMDDTLGFLGAKGFTVTDPAITTNVVDYVQQMLPSIESQVGVPVTLPPAPPVPSDDI